MDSAAEACPDGPREVCLLLGPPAGGRGGGFGRGVEGCSGKAQIGTWEAQRPQGRGLEELGLAQGRLGTRIWAQHGPNLSQVGANLGPAWAQLEPTWSQLGSMLGPDRLK